MTTDMDDAQIMAKTTERLCEKNADISREVIEKAVHEEFAALADRPIRDYLSVLTERAVKKRLKKLAKKDAS